MLPSFRTIGVVGNADNPLLETWSKGKRYHAQGACFLASFSLLVIYLKAGSASTILISERPVFLINRLPSANQSTTALVQPPLIRMGDENKTSQ
ncbi:hypothetical protein BDV33DRAFT_170220 [Aspergillus novoparasiticus]|uniref:Uncharacterized protein n=1 Tax=Aspergillus novoparasiticus TaxID=986946 RepID=A0A5N6EYY9_9EURO|nr:hypothetical protein BDV33DRAFT_170220 [Aspergillus novoparasiticus]